MVDISIIIPCYNAGVHISEAVESVKSYQGEYKYEIIITNDGSTDITTINELERLGSEGCKIINQVNRGPAAARNASIKISGGEFLLLLDSDNTIDPEYISIGIDKLKKNPGVGVIYSDPRFFGEIKETRFKTRKFDKYGLLLENFIDSCTVMRKEVWTDLNGFDEEKDLFGLEDWEFWIRVSATNWKFLYVNRQLFNYRIRANSLVNRFKDEDILDKAVSYSFKKNHEILLADYKELYQFYNVYMYDSQHPIRSFFKFMYKKYFKKK